MLEALRPWCLLSASRGCPWAWGCHGACPFLAPSRAAGARGDARCSPAPTSRPQSFGDHQVTPGGIGMGTSASGGWPVLSTLEGSNQLEQQARGRTRWVPGIFGGKVSGFGPVRRGLQRPSATPTRGVTPCREQINEVIPQTRPRSLLVDRICPCPPGSPLLAAPSGLEPPARPRAPGDLSRRLPPLSLRCRGRGRPGSANTNQLWLRARGGRRRRKKRSGPGKLNVHKCRPKRLKSRAVPLNLIKV